jgi:tRNA 2-thiouridine synthesizing protein A
MNKYHLNLRNLLCPLPVIKVQNKISQLKKGELLEVICTDIGVLQDIPAWCRINQHNILNVNENDDNIIFLIEVNKF